MELRHLRYFVAVAEELNFTRAAKRLHTAQPSLCQQIKQLEESIGVILLERNTHHVQLTAAGTVFLRESRKVLHRIQHAVELATRVATGKTGEISIGVCTWSEVRVVPKILPLMKKRLPQVELRIHGLSAGEQILALRDRSIDVGFLRGPFNEADLLTEEILREKVVLVLPARHRLAKMRNISLRTLHDLPCITATRKHPARDIATSLCAEAGVHVRAAQEADSAISHLNMVAAGLGFALLPGYVKSILPRGAVTKPVDCDPVPTASLVAAYRRGAQLPALRAFMKTVRECFVDFS